MAERPNAGSGGARPLSHQPEVWSGVKTRCVDDYTRSSVNLAVQVTESPKPHTIDMLSA